MGAETRRNDQSSRIKKHQQKITAVTKGRHESSLNKIEVAQHEWYFSKLTQDLLRHDDRKFVALLSVGKNKFHSHHSQKVLPSNADQVAEEKDK